MFSFPFHPLLHSSPPTSLNCLIFLGGWAEPATALAASGSIALHERGVVGKRPYTLAWREGQGHRSEVKGPLCPRVGVFGTWGKSGSLQVVLSCYRSQRLLFSCMNIIMQETLFKGLLLYRSVFSVCRRQQNLFPHHHHHHTRRSSRDSVSSIRVAPRMFGVHSICTRNVIFISCSGLRWRWEAVVTLNSMYSTSSWWCQCFITCCFQNCAQLCLRVVFWVFSKL